MSNPQSFYTVGGIDLSGIFQPLSLGTSSSVVTGYKVGGNDLNTIFAAYTGGTQAITTGYSVSGYGDLNNIFAKYNPINTISISVSNISTSYTSGINGSITWYKFVLSGTTTAQANVQFISSLGNSNCQINFCLIGGGDCGGGNNNTSGGTFTNNQQYGGGGGGIYYLNNVSINTLTNFTVQVGQAGLLQNSPYQAYRSQYPTSSIFSLYTASGGYQTTQGSGNYTGGNGGVSANTYPGQNGGTSSFYTTFGNFLGPDSNSYTLGGGGGSATENLIGYSNGGLAGNGIGGTAGGMGGMNFNYGENASVNSNNFGGGGGGCFPDYIPGSYPVPGTGNPGAVFLWWNTIQ
jgi:hypothetical protein